MCATAAPALGTAAAALDRRLRISSFRQDFAGAAAGTAALAFTAATAGTTGAGAALSRTAAIAPAVKIKGSFILREQGEYLPAPKW
mmetsp:Transcript_17632/g.35430  ORF Transcript_17632/g.35430 Transcript_17632/m.35430 type:complete len:86 (+) Transcript_17632:1016-1273(+)